MILFEDEELGDVVHDVEGDRSGGHVTLNLTEGGSGPQLLAGDVAKFEIRFNYVRDALRELFKPFGLNGIVREIDAHLHHVGTAQIGLAAAPVYLARGLSEDKLLECADRHIRGESNRAKGIVFVPRAATVSVLGLPRRPEFAGSHRQCHGGGRCGGRPVGL